MSQILSRKRSEGDEGWISVSDMMAGLMMIFLFIAVIYAKDADRRAKNVEEIVNEWQDSELEIYNALYEEFSDDLVEWNAEIQKKTLTIRFNSPEILFAKGEADLSDEFQILLDDFLPRYIKLLKGRFHDRIDEVRIEGHTSSEWRVQSSNIESFIENMKLSQARTRTVLEYGLAIPTLASETQWMTQTVSANGLSSAKLIIVNGVEDKTRSRRVDFTIKTKTKEALFRVLERISPPIEKSFQ